MASVVRLVYFNLRSTLMKDRKHVNYVNSVENIGLTGNILSLFVPLWWSSSPRGSSDVFWPGLCPNFGKRPYAEKERVWPHTHIRRGVCEMEAQSTRSCASWQSVERGSIFGIGSDYNPAQWCTLDVMSIAAPSLVLTLIMSLDEPDWTIFFMPLNRGWI